MSIPSARALAALVAIGSLGALSCADAPRTTLAPVHTTAATANETNALVPDDDATLATAESPLAFRPRFGRVLIAKDGVLNAVEVWDGDVAPEMTCPLAVVGTPKGGTLLMFAPALGSHAALASGWSTDATPIGVTLSGRLHGRTLKSLKAKLPTTLRDGTMFTMHVDLRDDVASSAADVRMIVCSQVST